MRTTVVRSCGAPVLVTVALWGLVFLSLLSFPAASASEEGEDAYVRVPLAAEPGSDPTADGEVDGDRIPSRSEAAHGTARRSVVSPDAVQPHEEHVRRAEFQSARTSEQGLTRSRDADVRKHGGEGGTLSFRLRGARAFEPRYSFAGAPLSVGQDGPQGLAFVTMPLVGGFRAFPDRSPFGEPQGGIGGAVDFQPCEEACFPSFGAGTREQGNTKGSHTAGVASLQAGSFGLLRASAGGAFAARDSFMAGALEASRSREDFRYLDDSETVRDESDDRLRRRVGNDFRRASAGARARVQAVPVLGAVETDAIGGAEERGLPGVAGAETPARLLRHFGMVAARFRSLAGGSGAEVRGKAHVTAGHARRRDIGSSLSTADTKATSAGTDFGGGGLVLVPLGHVTRVGLGIDAARSTQSNSRVRDGRSLGSVKAARDGARFSVFTGVTLESSEESGEGSGGAAGEATRASGSPGAALGIAFDADVEIARSRVRALCPARIAGCVDPGNVDEPALVSAAASVQGEFLVLVPYLRVSIARRRPSLAEAYGDAQALLPNPDLRAESSRKAEVGASTPYAKAALYVAADRDLIFLGKAGPRAVQATNLESGSRVGGLLSTDAPLGEHVRVGGSYHLLRATLRRTGERDATVPRSPEHSVKGTVTSSTGTIGLGTRGSTILAADTEALWQSPFYVDAANLIRYRPGVELSASLGATFRPSPPSSSTVSLRLQGENLLEPRARQRDAAGGDVAVSHAGFPGFPEPGRRYYVTIASSF